MSNQLFHSSIKVIGLNNLPSLGRLFGLLACVAALVVTFACGKDDTNSRDKSNLGKEKTGPSTGKSFTDNLPAGLALPDRTDKTGRRLLSDYGAMFVARGGAAPPPVIIFSGDAELEKWQGSVATAREDINGVAIELQQPAMTALLDARREAQGSQLDITPRGSDAAKRNYADTVRLWQSRVDPGLDHWVKEGRLNKSEATRIRQLSPRDQISEILSLEDNGMYFSKDFAKSILYSVAAPGSSQHLSMLALDVNQYDNAEVRTILARHGWFQTVASDTPHFTFLGVQEEDLPSLGLKKMTNSVQTFWIPQLD